MSRRHEDSVHIQTLKRELAEARETTHTGIQTIVYDFPEIADLLHAVSDLIYTADPKKGATTDGDGRGTTNTLSTDGLSTASGRSTLRDRKRLDRWRRNVAHMVRNIENEMDPNYKRPPPRITKQCKRVGCPQENTRQDDAVRFCNFCGREFTVTDRTEGIPKTRFTLVERDES